MGIWGKKREERDSTWMCEIEIEIERERERERWSLVHTHECSRQQASNTGVCVCVLWWIGRKRSDDCGWFIGTPVFGGFSHWNRNSFLGAHDGAWLWLWLWLLAKSSNPVECGLWVFSAALFFVVLLCLVGVGRSLWLWCHSTRLLFNFFFFI